MASIPVGIQLYSVRENCQKDFEGTVRALADMGYEGVEFAGNYGGMSPGELAEFLKGLGLQACGIHAPANHVDDPQSESYDYANGIGCPYISTSLAGQVEKDWDAAIELVQRAGRAAAERGVQFTYHNHAQEFATIDGEYALDLLYARTDPQQVQAQLDTHWIKRGGPDPAEYIRKYAGRMPQLHMKDVGPNDEFIEIGNGILDLPAILAATADAGAKWIIYEQDRCKGPEIESARTSITNLRKVLT